MVGRNRFSSVQGGSGGSNVTLTCACRTEIEGYTQPCSCVEQKFFLNDAPRQWICPKCKKGTHKFTH